ncbi:hypothetical protein ACTJJ4_17150 [Microbacterium sp. 22195]|uniref:hypothetical protein n=1 Tax=Microbacterium sp. 22195 TaxID=3453891 RepID=UPI003F8773CA
MTTGNEGQLSRTNQASPAPSAKRKEIALSGSIPERWTLAGAADLEPEIAQILATDDDFRVLQSLANNRSVAQEILAMLGRRAEVAEQVAMNPFAPPEIKEMRPLTFHPSISITNFLTDVGATEDQSRELMKRYERAMRKQDHAETLGDAWRQIVEMTNRE